MMYFYEDKKYKVTLHRDEIFHFGCGCEYTLENYRNHFTDDDTTLICCDDGAIVRTRYTNNVELTLDEIYILLSGDISKMYKNAVLDDLYFYLEDYEYIADIKHIEIDGKSLNMALYYELVESIKSIDGLKGLLVDRGGRKYLDLDVYLHIRGMDTEEILSEEEMKAHYRECILKLIKTKPHIFI